MGDSLWYFARHLNIPEKSPSVSEAWTLSFQQMSSNLPDIQT
ncbi:hypothetical protein L917_18849, partial [Phytophthora nicotianae]